MTRPTETVKALALIGQLCPSQRIDEFTADAWHPLLEPYDLEDVVAAIYDTAARSRYVDVSDVVLGAKARRQLRATDGPEPVPRADPDDPVAYRDELASQRLARAQAPTARREVTQ